MSAHKEGGSDSLNGGGKGIGLIRGKERGEEKGRIERMEKITQENKEYQRKRSGPFGKKNVKILGKMRDAYDEG